MHEVSTVDYSVHPSVDDTLVTHPITETAKAPWLRASEHLDAPSEHGVQWCRRAFGR